MRNKIITLLLVISAVAHAQTDRTEALILSENNGWEYEVKAGINIGGASPIPLPVEIRKVESYSPKFNGTIEGVVTKWLGAEKKWGISAGLKFEEKGMITGAQVKAYGMEIISEGSRVSGLWTGHVKTNYNSTMLTIPVMANYKLGRL
ncbi:MAG: PorT family protein, partial [Prevotella micans]|nr:PorT family protein [Prevotella micans]